MANMKLQGLLHLVQLITIFSFAVCLDDLNLTFPDGFHFGAATASYQVEGAWNVDGKGESIWDFFTHTYPERVVDHTNGDDAAKSYYQYKQDVQAVKFMGMDVYRFSVAWTRIMPTGLPNYVNPKGIEYYNNLIDELLKNGISPMITIYHWDLPQNLQNLGGWSNEFVVSCYEEYAKVLFQNFGDRVKWWITFNEPFVTALSYELSTFAPGVNTFGVGPYLVTHNILKAHARAYHLYDKEFRQEQNGKITLTAQIQFPVPLNSTSEDDIEAADWFIQFQLGWFYNPIYSEEGDYPQVMIDIIGNRSLAEGYSVSRLPKFTPEEVNYIRGTADYLGINTYTAFLITKMTENENNVTSYMGDTSSLVYTDKSWTSSKQSDWNAIVPFSLRKSLNWIKDHYGDHWEIYITENGFADGADHNDTMRITYLATYLIDLWKAIYIDGCNVVGYTVWSLIDNLEWTFGYASKWGLFHVDFKDPNRKRTPKQSAFFMKNVTATRTIPHDYIAIEEKFNNNILNAKHRGKLQRQFHPEKGRPI